MLSIYVHPLSICQVGLVYEATSCKLEPHYNSGQITSIFL